MVNKFERRKSLILQALQDQESLSVDEASTLLGTSAATTRRFFKELAHEGSVVRIHGGVRLVPDRQGSYSYIMATTRRVEQKARIAQAAVAYVEEGDVLFLDSGSTMLKMAQALETRIRSEGFSSIIVVTNSLVSYEKLCPCCKVILSGGQVRLSRRDTFGPIAEQALASLNVRKAFFGADGIHPDKGLMATDAETCRMNEIVHSQSDSVIVLADSEKFGRSSLLSYAALDAVRVIITDNGISDEALTPYRERGATIEVVCLCIYPSLHPSRLISTTVRLAEACIYVSNGDLLIIDENDPPAV